jgi:hypothetical protein
LDLDPPKVQQFILLTQNNESMLPSRPSSAIGTNIFKEIWIAHRSLGSLRINYRVHTPRFHTPKSVQGLEINLHEHRRIATMFQ